MKQINDILDQNISEFHSLRDSANKESGYLIAESEKVVLKLINSPFKVFKILGTDDFYQKHHDLIGQVDTDKFVAKKELMQKIVGHNLHHGILALGERPQNALLSDLSFPLVVLNGLVSAENVGAIIRNCAAFGIRSLLCDSKTCSPYIRRAVRVSMGNIFSMVVRETNDLESDLLALQKKGINIITTANIPEAKNINEFQNRNNRYAVVIGNEGYGIDQNILTLSNHVLRIPIDHNVAAINAACASAVFLYALEIKTL